MLFKLDIEIYKGNIINNDIVPTVETRQFINPLTGLPLFETPVSRKEDLDSAVQCAIQAFKSWSTTPWSERAKLLVEYANAIEFHRDDLVNLLTLENAKPLPLSRSEVDLTSSWMRSFAEMEIKDEILKEDDTKIVYLTHLPLGVSAGIVPWNTPILLGSIKLGSGILTGNTFIMKPSPFMPHCNLELGEIASQIFPPGVVQVLSGNGDLGPWITEHPGIDKISFTGSIPTGKPVAASCAKTLKRVTLELGGNDPAIICEDVEIDKVVPRIATLCFLNSGQICALPKRVYVHEKIYDEFRDKMVEFTMNRIRTGAGTEDGVMIGPIQNEMQFKKAKDLYAEIDKNGWKAALTGSADHSTDGYIVTPSIIDNPPEESRVVTEEPFGPIFPLLKWFDEDNVVDRANALPTGLGASVWSNNLNRAESMARRLEAGCVWVNSHFDTHPDVPQGDIKENGIGVEAGMEGLKHFMNPRSLWVFKEA